MRCKSIRNIKPQVLKRGVIAFAAGGVHGQPDRLSQSGQPVDVRPQSGIPYSGTLTFIDPDGRELFLSDNKNPFQYFYQLGVEVINSISFFYCFCSEKSYGRTASEALGVLKQQCCFLWAKNTNVSSFNVLNELTT